MAEVLLRELSNADINWMIATGRQEQVAAGTVLVQLCRDPEVIYLLLDGALSIVIPKAESSATSSALAIGDCKDQEVTHLSRGEIVGETSLFDLCFMPAVVKANENSLVLAIPRPQLVEKLEQDIYFGTHFYRAIALMLSERLRKILEMPGQIQAVTEQPMKEALFVFGELRDSDVDWLVAAGEVKSLAPNEVLIQAGKPIEALYFVLDGLLLIASPEGDYNPLTLCFECRDKLASSEKAIANLTRGEISGAIAFLDFRPPATTVRAVNHALVLAIPRQVLTAKLQQDMSFAFRFYRVLALQLSNSLQTVMSRLGCNKNTYQHQDMNEAVEYEDELDLDSLQQVSQGAARFNWMLKRIGVI
jgi:CRP-like cAMP-binding protein